MAPNSKPRYDRAAGHPQIVCNGDRLQHGVRSAVPLHVASKPEDIAQVGHAAISATSPASCQFGEEYRSVFQVGGVEAFGDGMVSTSPPRWPDKPSCLWPPAPGRCSRLCGTALRRPPYALATTATGLGAGPAPLRTSAPLFFASAAGHRSTGPSSPRFDPRFHMLSREGRYGQALGVARRHQPRPAVGRAGPAGRGMRPPRTRLRLVGRAQKWQCGGGQIFHSVPAKVVLPPSVFPASPLPLVRRHPEALVGAGDIISNSLRTPAAISA